MARLPKADPLRAYLTVDREMERNLVIILRRMASAVEKDIRALESRQGFSVRIAADQKRLLLMAIRRREGQAWTVIGHTVSAAQANAAAAAVNSTQDFVDMLTKAKLSRAEQLAMREAAVAQAERNVDAAVMRELHTRIPLSKQVYRTRSLASGQVDRVVTTAIGRGLNAREIAREVARFISPDVPGGVSYAAMRLGRTELNNAFHATQISYAKGNPFVTAMKWNLSGSHKRPDQCNDFADHEAYTPNEVPSKPHPQCFCYLTPVVEDEAVFVQKFLAGAYDQDLAGIL